MGLAQDGQIGFYPHQILGTSLKLIGLSRVLKDIKKHLKTSAGLTQNHQCHYITLNCNDICTVMITQQSYCEGQHLEVAALNRPLPITVVAKLLQQGMLKYVSHYSLQQINNKLSPLL